MKLFQGLALMVALSAFGGLSQVVAQQQGEPNIAPKHAILVGKGIQLWLYIYSDGSGTVGYGAGGSHQGHFKAGTFDVEQVTKQLKTLPVQKKQQLTYYYFDFESERKEQDHPGAGNYTPDEKYIPSLFQQAMAASGLPAYSRVRTIPSSAASGPADPAPGPHKNLPEMEPLKQWAGSWESEWKLAKQWDLKETATTEWVMDGFFLQTTFHLENTTLAQKTHGKMMMTYDLAAKSFRRWEFSSNGGHADNVGVWDMKTRTMTWTYQTAQVKVVTTETFTDDDTMRWHQVTKNKAGMVISEALGEKRRKR